MQLFRFQPFTKYSIQNLTLKQNWASKVSEFNDPFEFPIGGVYQWDESNEYKPISGEQDKVRRRIIKSMNKFGVVSYTSFASEVNPYPEHNVLMWSHYGDSHKGFCLVFEVEFPLPNDIRKVNYRNTIPKLNYEESENYLEILITKSLDWKYESEYRQFNKDGNQGIKYPGKLIEIVFGCRATVADMNLVLNLCDNLYEEKIAFSRVYMTDGNLHLNKETWVTHKKGDNVPKHVLLKNDYDDARNTHL